MNNKDNPTKSRTKPATDAGWGLLDQKKTRHRPWDINVTNRTGNQDLSASSNQVQEILISQISPDPDQPRKTFDSLSISALAQSISDPDVGLIEPIVVRRIIGTEQSYQLIAGERRWRACQSLHHKTIKAIVLDVSANQAFKISVIENINRESLNVIEKAMAFRALLAKSIFPNQTQMSAELGLTRTALVKSLRLLERLSKKAIEAYLSNAEAITEGHLHAIMRAPLETQETLINKTKNENWTVQQLRGYIAEHYFTESRSATVGLREKRQNWFDLEIHVRPKTTKTEIRELIATLKTTLAKLKKLEKGTENS